MEIKLVNAAVCQQGLLLRATEMRYEEALLIDFQASNTSLERAFMITTK